MKIPFRFRRRSIPAPTVAHRASDAHPPMRVESVTLDELRDIARRSGIATAINYEARKAYLRMAQTRYEAPLPVDTAH